MNTRSIIIAISLVWTTVNAWAQTPAPTSSAGYTTGLGYRNTSSILQEPWVQGFIDGVLVTNHLATPQGNTEWLRSCIRGMNADQIAAILNKYLTDHPTEWHKPMSLTAMSALKIACKR